MRFAGAAADHRMMGFIEAEIFVAERRDRDETVGAGLEQSHEQTCTRDARYARLKRGADLVGEITGDQAIHGLAFRRHGAALGCGNARGNFGQLAQAHVRQTARPEIERAD